MKQVWILNHYAQEPSGTGGTRHFHLAQYLVPHGWQATVIASVVEQRSGVQRLAKGEAQRLERISGVPFLWVRVPEYSGNGSGRMVNMLVYALRVLLKRTTASLPRPDAIIGSSVHPFAALSGALLARRFKIPFFFEVRDLWPQTLIDMGRLSDRSYLTWLLRKLEIWLYRRSKRIVVLLPFAWKYIVPLGIPKERVIWIPNGVDLSLYPKLPAPVRADDAPFTLMYFGAHGQANGLENLLLAMKLVQDEAPKMKIRLRMIGDGPMKPGLVERAQQLALRNVIFEPSVPKSQVPNLAAEADAFVISVLGLPNLYRYGISMNKLFDYLATERPIIIASDASNNPVRDAGAGLTVKADQPDLLAKAIVEIARTSKEERCRMAANGRKYVEQHHSFNQLAKQLADVLNSPPVKLET